MSGPSTIPNKIDLARSIYEKVGRDDFDSDVWHHLHNYYVISNPWGFLTLMPEQLDDGDLAWRVTNAVGPLHVLITMVPFRLPYFTFQRSKGSSRMRKIPFGRMKRAAEKQSP